MIHTHRALEPPRKNTQLDNKRLAENVNQPTEFRKRCWLYQAFSYLLRRALCPKEQAFSNLISLVVAVSEINLEVFHMDSPCFDPPFLDISIEEETWKLELITIKS